MLTRASYIAILEKKAAEESDPPRKDNREIAVDEHSKNQADSRTYLHGLFNKAKSTEEETTRDIKKLFSDSGEKDSRTALLKLARMMFEVAVTDLPMLKTASLSAREVVFMGFTDELEKIAAPASIANMKSAVKSMNTNVANMNKATKPGQEARAFLNLVKKAAINPTTIGQMTRRNAMGQAWKGGQGTVHDLSHMMGGGAPVRPRIEDRLAASRAEKGNGVVGKIKGLFSR